LDEITKTGRTLKVKTFLFPLLEKYLRKEGFSYLLPESKDNTLFSYTLIFLILLTNALIMKFFQNSFWLGS